MWWVENEKPSGTASPLMTQEKLSELGQAMERINVLGQQVDKLCAELRDRDATTKLRDSHLATLQSAADQRKRALDEEAEKLHKEKVRRLRLEEEVKVISSHVWCFRYPCSQTPRPLFASIPR